MHKKIERNEKHYKSYTSMSKMCNNMQSTTLYWKGWIKFVSLLF